MDAETIQRIILIIPGFLIAVTVHEYAHGYVALRFGDHTAERAGRLTLNPIPHIDPFGALALVLTQMIGWAKPVPVDPRNLRDPRKDMIWISLGGPAANLIAASVAALIFHGLIFTFGVKALHPQLSPILSPFVRMTAFAVVINIGLGVFNLVPIPPLDGSKILAGALPRDLAYKYEQLEPYGFIILLLLIFTGVVGYVIAPPIRALVGVLLGGYA